MAWPRVIEDDQFVLDANPWEEELEDWQEEEEEEEEEQEEEEEEEKEEETEQEQEIQATEAIPSPTRSVPNSPVKPTAQPQKGLALIFVQVDQQIELLAKQLNNVQAELLRARNLVTTVRSTVTGLNKPRARDLLEIDIFTNYLRIGEELKTIANNIGMIVPDHGRQLVRVPKNDEERSIYSETDVDEAFGEHTVSASQVSESDEASFYEELDFSGSAFDAHGVHEDTVSIQEYWDDQEQKHRITSYDYDSYHGSPLRYPPSAPAADPRQPTRPRYSEDYTYDLTHELEGQRRETIFHERRPVFYDARRFDSNSSRAHGSAYAHGADSSQLEDWADNPYYIRIRPLSPRDPYHDTEKRRRRSHFQAASTASSKHHPSSSTSGVYVGTNDYSEILVKEDNQAPFMKPEIVLRRSRGALSLKLETALREEQALLIKRLYEVQGQLVGATRVIQEKESPITNAERVGNSNLKGNLWARLKLKLIPSNKKQEEDDI